MTQGTIRQGRLSPRLRALQKTVSRMTTPLLPDDYLSLLNPLWSSRELRGKVIKVIPENESAATLVIKPGWGFSFDYQAGQYVGIGVQIDGRYQWRSYSLTSPPKRDQGHIAITIKAMPEGRLSSHLVNGLEPGTIVRLALPQGEFVLPDPPPARILFLTGGSGLTPVMAMLRSLHRRGSLEAPSENAAGESPVGTDVVLVHAAPSADDVLFRRELHELAGTYTTLHVHEHHSDRLGQLSLDSLASIVPDWAERETWACGPAPMLADAERVYAAAGVAKRLHLERFSAVRTSGGKGGTITFDASGRSTAVDGATTILEAAEAIGVALPFGCRMGICHTCVLPLATGVARDLRTGDLRHENENVQTCVSAPDGDCSLAY